ncbi:hypothetical protein B0T16DRAFT_147177 [Cercophora newfieldiana]|uniref:F-box domain-containing protein n=1 Tax=Cercophora newfieldiana TaxID=92897 RepID=A0AA39Y4J2_9PEZI|nr:hypothetical protein B0T16DRAFT_147177 [Cercophora newfieldiana]
MSLLHLPNETLVQVAEDVGASGVKVHLVNLGQTCKRLSQIVQPIIYRVISIYWPTSNYRAHQNRPCDLRYVKSPFFVPPFGSFLAARCLWGSTHLRDIFLPPDCLEGK